jgi:DNA-binding transcriptional MerR regulator
VSRQRSNRKPDTAKQGLLRISELAKETEVPIPTLHFYLREGLLEPSIKTARNMAYYSPDCIEDIQWIRELQSKRFLPLSVIKWLMEARRDGQDINHIAEMDTLADHLFRPVTTGPKDLSFTELAEASGLSPSVLKQLEKSGLLIPSGTGQNKRYDDLDLRIAQTVRELAGFSLTASDLSVYSKYIQAIRDEAMTIHNKMHDAGLTGTVPLAGLVRTLNDFKMYLSMKVYRQFAVESHEFTPVQKEGKLH